MAQLIIVYLGLIRCSDSMEIIWSKSIDPILSVGRSLEGAGVRNWALDRAAALNALDRLLVIGVAVLGGDVYVANGSSIDSNCDNWYCDRDHGEAESAFVERSIAKARNYIVNYQSPIEPVSFALIPAQTAAGSLPDCP